MPYVDSIEKIKSEVTSNIISEIETRIEKAECRLRKHQINMKKTTDKVKAKLLGTAILQERETAAELKDLRMWIFNNIPGIPTKNS